MDYDWILIGLNWIGSLKCLEMTFVLIWRYMKKIEFNRIEFKHVTDFLRNPFRLHTISNVKQVSVCSVSKSASGQTLKL